MQQLEILENKNIEEEFRHSVKLDVFEGPLELLLHLLKKNKVSIYDIPIVQITEQYFEYMNTLKEFDIEYSSEFVVIAAELLYIKSKVLLPKHDEEEDDSEELAHNLTEALKERARMKIISERFRTMQFDGTFRFFKEEEKIEKNNIQASILYI